MNSWFSNSPASQICPQNSPQRGPPSRVLVFLPFSSVRRQGLFLPLFISVEAFLLQYQLTLLLFANLLLLFKGYSSLAVFSNKISRFPSRCQVVSSRELRVAVKAHSCIRAQCRVHLCFVWYSDLFSPRQTPLSTCDDVGKYPPSPGSGPELW